jgi:GNAT superfamily N-acetyltransferase
VTSNQGPTVADSVRLALPGEASSIAEIQRRGWMNQQPSGAAELLLSGIDVEAMTEAWERAISRPPRAQFRVLVAVERHRVVGFASTVPSEDPDAEAGVDGLIDEFAIDPAAQRRGHGSRLLNACVDTLRSDGFSRATWWMNSSDDAMRRFLISAGWAPDGGWREIGSDDETVRLKQIRLHVDISASG